MGAGVAVGEAVWNGVPLGTAEGAGLALGRLPIPQAVSSSENMMMGRVVRAAVIEPDYPTPAHIGERVKRICLQEIPSVQKATANRPLSELYATTGNRSLDEPSFRLAGLEDPLKRP